MSFRARNFSRFRSRSQTVGWFSTAAYYANDNADGVAKLPGYVANFRKGLYAKPKLSAVEKVVNGTFNTDLNGWVDASTAPSTTVWSSANGGQVLFQTDGTNGARIRQQVTGLTVGRIYAFNVGNVSNVQPFLGTSAGASDILPSAGAGNRYFAAPATSVWINTATPVNGATMDNISIREVVGLSSAVFSDLFRFTRAGQATYIDAAGNLQTAANDEPRFDYSNGKRQLLLEGGSTNLVVNNLSNANLISLGGITPVVVSSGVLPNGMAYQDVRWQGTPTSTAGSLSYAVTTVVAADAEIVTGSWYAQIIAGNVPTSNGVCGLRLDFVGGTTSTTFPLSNIFSRVIITRTAGTGTTGAVLAFRMGVTNGEPVDVTVRFALPQIEKQPFASSVIKTSGSAVTRAPDSCRFTEDHRALIALTAASALVQAEGIYSTESVNPANLIASTNRVIGTNSAKNTMIIGNIAVISNGSFTMPLPSFGTMGAWSSAGKAISYNSTAVSSDAVALDSNVTDMYLGRAAAAFGQGWYDQLVTYPFRIANSNLPGKAIPYAA